jgi:hypothetical protein
MNRITIVALTTTFTAAVVAACGGSTKSSSTSGNEGDGGGTSSSSSGGGSSSGASSGGGDTGDAQSMTYSLGEGGPTIVTTLNCQSATGCNTGDVCCGTLGYAISGGLSITFTSACAASCPASATEYQVCATAQECTTAGDTCTSLANAYGAGGAGAGADLPDISICMPEGGVAMTNDAGCYVYGGQTYCLGEGGYPEANDAGCYVYGGQTYCKGEGGYVKEDSGSSTATEAGTTPTEAGTTTTSDAGTD